MRLFLCLHPKFSGFAAPFVFDAYFFCLQFSAEPLKGIFMKRPGAWLSGEMALPARPDAWFEERAYARGHRFVAGLDEAGRGPLAGPVVAAAVVLPRGIVHAEIQDSKLLAAKKRESLAVWIKQNALAWGLGVVDSGRIDRVNILTASLLAMAEAVKRLELLPDYLLVDGTQKIPPGFLPNFPRQRALKKGDRRSVSIAAASILAKVARDEIMLEYHRIYPEYGFGQHKGYASPFHLAALSRYGPSPIHRRSFGPVREWLRSPAEAAPASLFRKG